MRIPCPFCGSRDSGEFAHRGDARPVRPAGDASAAMFDYLYLRDNPMGAIEEHWYHAQGCRQWLVVARDTLTHAVAGARIAASGGEGAA